MGDIAIRVENLSKQYRIGGPQARYKTIRESLTGAVGAPFRRLSSVVRGQSSAVSNETIWALKDVSFEVQRGEVVGIIGRNGAGKTTLLKVLSRITEPTEGYAEIHGRVGSLLEVGTGFHPELTGRENIYLNGAILGMKRVEIECKFDEIVDFAEIEKFIDTPVKHYSSGMYVRLAFAVAAHLEPEILLVDEVLAVGDVEFQKKCLGKMGDVAKEGRTVLFVSHNMAAVSRLCSRGILLQDGQVAYEGTAAGAIDRYLNEVNSAKENKKMEWIAPNDDYPFADVVKIKRYYIQDQEGNIPEGQVFCSKNYEVIIETEIYRAHPNLVFFLTYYAEDTLLFVSDVHDTGELNIAKSGPGNVRLSAPLPVHLFSQRTYEVELSCVIHNEGWVLLPDPNRRLEFSVLKDVDSNSMGYSELNHPFTGGARPGLLAPVICWKIR